MSLAFYFDEHIPIPLANGCLRRELDVLTIQRDDMIGASDEEVLDRAISLGRVLVMMDKDFIIMGAERQRTGKHFPGIIIIKAHRFALARVLEDLVLLSSCDASEELAGTISYLPI